MPGRRVAVAFAAVMSLCLVPPSYGGDISPDPSSQSYRLHLAGRPWALALEIPGFLVDEERVRERGEATMMLARHEGGDMAVSIYLERRPQPVTARRCRDESWAAGQNAPIARSNVQLSDPGDLSVVRWTLAEYEGRRLDQQHVEVFLGREDVCLSVHLSKMNYREGEDQLFGEILRSLRYEAAPVQAARAVDVAPQSFTLSATRRLTLDLPVAWRAAFRRGTPLQPSTVTITPAQGEPFQLLLSIMGAGGGIEPRAFVEDAGRRALERAVEKAVKLEPLGGPGRTGYYFNLTDRAPEPKGYKYLTQGAIADPSGLLVFTFLTNSASRADQQKARAMVAAARISTGR